MKIKEVKERVKEMRIKAHDIEELHFLEDRLREDFIKHVAKSEPHLRKMAELILSTSEIANGVRWYS